MADVKWIKIMTDIFDDEKMLLIDGMPERDGIITIWFKLLCMAGKTNNGGVFMMQNITLTDEMLALILRRPLATVRLALQTFEQFGMIEFINGAVTIPNWDKHQSLDAYAKKKERDRDARKEYRKAKFNDNLENELFIIDIIREEMTGNDLRLR
jgi:predicted phage replisome organizer